MTYYDFLKHVLRLLYAWSRSLRSADRLDDASLLATVQDEIRALGHDPDAL